MSLRTRLISIFMGKKEEESFIENELPEMGPGLKKKSKKVGKNGK